MENQSQIVERIWKNIKEVRKKNPLVHNITNYVVMNFTANVLLAVGASPIMAHSPSELKELINVADSLVINIGTVDENWKDYMIEAAKYTKQLNKPMILDPVGAGATRFRTDTSLQLIKEGNVSVVRGNFGEIMSLIGIEGMTKGVDSKEFKEEFAMSALSKLKEKIRDGTIVISGPVDYISDGKVLFKCHNGVELLTKVTGSGCALTSLIGAFISVDNPLYASLSAVCMFNISAEKAYEKFKTSGSFAVGLIDSLQTIAKEDIEKRIKVDVIKV